MTNVPLEEQTKESLIAYIKSLETTCEAQDAAAQKAQLELGRAGLTGKQVEAVMALLERVQFKKDWCPADAEDVRKIDESIFKCLRACRKAGLK